MRVFLDVGRIAPDSASLRDACARAREAGVTDLWIAFERGDTAKRDSLRVAGDGLVAPERVVSYELPLGVEPAREPIRKQFFEARGAGLVLTLAECADSATLRSRISAATSAHAAPPARARVALVSPLPPLRSGVAFHAAELLPHLRESFDVEVVTSQRDANPASPGGSAPRTPEWFLANAGAFDAVIYHVGNSPAHDFVLQLLEQRPGIVVLHDVYLADLMAARERSGSRPHALVRALHESHGWPALAFLAREGRTAAISNYPASAGVLERATRVIVHSGHARDMIGQWWGPELAARCDVVPLLREAHERPSREEARRRLAIGPDEFVVCSFGLIGPTKCNADLLDGFLASSVAQDLRCRLVFVGENPPTEFGAELSRRVAAHTAPARVAITGFVDAAEYSLWLAAADMAIQLRTRSRGETSAAVLDCLAHGVPTIVNAHGSAARLPDEIVAKLPDAFSPTELAREIERLRADPPARVRIGTAATAYVREQHGAASVMRGYVAAVAAAAASPVASRLRLTDELGWSLKGQQRDVLAGIAEAIAANQPSIGPQRLLVDVSAMVHADLKTGIQRVVRQLVKQWLHAAPAGWRIDLVFSPGPGRPWRYARRFAAQLAGLPRLRLEEPVVEWRPGDLFLGLDLHTEMVGANEPLLLAMRERGVKIVFTVYDLLPVRMPQHFPTASVPLFERWLRTISRVSDAIVAISRATADDYARWLGEHPPQRELPLDVGSFELGADLPRDAETRIGWMASRALRRATQRPALLMVGTVEPRKGHRQALDAMEMLWRRGVDVNLVVVGMAGWKNDALVRRLQKHPERNRRLFWFGHAPDALMMKLYESCAALLAASEGEGFGLPLVEAAQHRLPVIARDLPVFREVAGVHAFYFDGSSADDLAGAIDRWLAFRARGEQPRSDALPWITWERSARSLEEVVLGGRWLTRWRPAKQEMQE